MATKNPYVAGATAVVVVATTATCAYAFGAGQRKTLW